MRCRLLAGANRPVVGQRPAHCLLLTHGGGKLIRSRSFDSSRRLTKFCLQQARLGSSSSALFTHRSTHAAKFSWDLLLIHLLLLFRRPVGAGFLGQSAGLAEVKLALHSVYPRNEERPRRSGANHHYRELFTSSFDNAVPKMVFAPGTQRVPCFTSFM